MSLRTTAPQHRSHRPQCICMQPPHRHLRRWWRWRWRWDCWSESAPTPQTLLQRADASAAAAALSHTTATTQRNAPVTSHVKYAPSDTTPAINEGCTRSLRISHSTVCTVSYQQPVSKTQVPCTPYHPPNIAGVSTCESKFAYLNNVLSVRSVQESWRKHGGAKV